ncbi:MAG: MaoC family dehydratase N-terminal domain-containing protein [Intrasporangium sp.]|uniref:MaoC/PaaZ C-terminal domain-containing protein n=1 Tax=Intrasporangium sp. TaxID=1925024 RepID=UPI00264A445C|nr:MaoC/PaaZ C-terminal domain-containing protein [Intrasporangium sp.]MDN5795763.1 MaoC family dehydratase N-terminal domain-containing protein [Intrasporangium sp.]
MAPVPVLLPAQDMPVGQEIDCGSYEVTEDEILAFASAWDPQYFHVDRDAATHSAFGGLIASGLHTASVFQRLAATRVYNRYDVVAGKRIENLRFLRPVRAGDVLACTVLVRSVKPDGRGRCLVRILGTLRDQHDRPVLELEVDSLVRSRDQP